MVMQSIDERFQQLEQHNILFGFLYYISNINKKTPADILTDCKHLETPLTHNANKDIESDDLCNGLQVVARRLPKPMSPSDELQVVARRLPKPMSPSDELQVVARRFLKHMSPSDVL